MLIQKVKNFSYDNLFLASLFVMCVALPTSIFLISVAQFGLAISWFWKGNYMQSFQKFIANKTAVCISIIYLLHLLWLINTSNFNYAANDLRIKIPLLIIPFILSAFDVLNRKNFIFLIKIFVLSTLVSTLISTFILLGFTGKKVSDVRQIFIFISHIRLALMICMSIFFTGYIIVKESLQSVIKLIAYAVILWFVYFLFLMESGTGIVVLFSILFMLFIFFVLQKISTLSKIIMASAMLILCSVAYSFINKKYVEFSYIKPQQFENLPQKTALGNVYEHQTQYTETENGNYVGLCQNWRECAEAWNMRSNINADSTDLKKQSIKQTINRYLTSKGYAKDASGINKLTNLDIKNIELGVTNYKYANAGIERRLTDIFYEYRLFKKNANANGHSVYMRWHFWKTGFEIIKQNLFFGVGEGDVNDSFLAQYKKDKSTLFTNYRLRAHNQFITIAVAFGIVGFCFFCIALFVIVKLNIGNYYAVIFMGVSILSFINEDTLETSTGAVFFAFFASFLTILYPQNNNESIKSNSALSSI